MKMDELKINADEKAVFILRSLYEEYGFARYKMNKFEEYELYLQNKDFLVSESIITFTDTNGKMMALKPDVTLSIVKNSTDDVKLQKVYYNENVYRVSKGTGSFKEIMQVGLECIGDINASVIKEVLLLALKSLEAVSNDYVLDISNNGILEEILNNLGVFRENRKKLLCCIGEKRVDEIVNYGGNYSLRKLLLSGGTVAEVTPLLSELYAGELSGLAKSFLKTVSELENEGYEGKIRIDFSVLNDLNYYNDTVFKGFVSGEAHSILSGGRYDSLMKKMGKRAGAIGFAVYLDFLERRKERVDERQRAVLNIALPKGRLGEKVYDLFERAGYECPSVKEVNRRLIFVNDALAIRYFWVKPSDVAIYVERGAADIGVCGKDILLEYEPDVYELSDLHMGKCRVAVAAKKDFVDDKQKTLRVATKFSNIAKTYYHAKGRDIDIVHLNGSIEIAPVLGMTDVIVDIVETGTTLRENDLVVLEEIVPISARLIANKSSCKFKGERIKALARALEAQTEEGK